MSTPTGDKTADFLLRQIRLLRRVGDAAHRRDADRWEMVVRSHAQPEQEQVAVSFATGKSSHEAGQKKF